MSHKFSLHPKELNNAKGFIAERLIRAYLDKVWIPNLKNKFEIEEKLIKKASDLEVVLQRYHKGKYDT